MIHVLIGCGKAKGAEGPSEAKALLQAVTCPLPPVRGSCTQGAPLGPGSWMQGSPASGSRMSLRGLRPKLSPAGPRSFLMSDPRPGLPPGVWGTGQRPPGSPTLPSGVVARPALAAASSPVSPWTFWDILCMQLWAGPQRYCAGPYSEPPRASQYFSLPWRPVCPLRLLTSDLPPPLQAGPLQSLCANAGGGGGAGQAGWEGRGRWIFLCGLGSLSGRCCQSGGLEAGPEGGAAGPTGRGCPGGPCLSSR